MRKWSVVSLAAAAMSACGLSSGVAAPPLAMVRAVNAVSDVALSNWSLNGLISFSDVLFGASFPASGYARWEVGTTIGVSASLLGAPFFNRTFANITVGNRYTLVAIGNVTAGVAPMDTVVALADTTGISASSVLVRIFNAVDYLAQAGGDPVDVYVYPQGTIRPATPDVAGLAWSAASAYRSVSLATSTALVVDVFAAGAASTGTPLFTTIMTGLVVGKVRTVILRDPPSTAAVGTSGSVLVLLDN